MSEVKVANNVRSIGEELVSIPIYAKWIGLSDDVRDQFLSFTYRKGERFYKVKFTRDCNKRPTEAGYWVITAKKKDVSVPSSEDSFEYKDTDPDKSKRFKKSVIWVRDVVSVAPDTNSEKDAEHYRIKRTDAFFKE